MARTITCFTGSAGRIGAAHRDRVVEPAGESDSESECMGLARFAFRLIGCGDNCRRSPLSVSIDLSFNRQSGTRLSLCRTRGTIGTTLGNYSEQKGQSVRVWWLVNKKEKGESL